MEAQNTVSFEITPYSLSAMNECHEQKLGVVQ